MESGTQLGHYTILSPIGKGGMGEVWRARDNKLGREVAIKILPEEFSKDPDRLARFEREAKLLASLNHPNIGAIYGFEENNGTYFLVMELVEGPTLAERIAEGPIPVDEALRIARQMADAVEYAHERAVMHRDLKPSNIKLTKDGTVKVLDFGLAKALNKDDKSPVTSNSPTLSLAATQAGVILGTAAYMSPEQAKGKEVDRRADIWAFGVVVYEMLTGRRMFSGETVSETMAAVMMKEPDWDALPDGLPSSVEAFLRRCLQKDPKQRIRDIGDVRLALDGAFEALVPQTTASASDVPMRATVFVAVVGSLLVGALVAATVLWSLGWHLAPSAPEARLDIITPATTDPTSFAISPDGAQIAFVATEDGQTRLWLRSFDADAAYPLARTEGARLPFWSPDGKSLGFFAQGQLKRLDLEGGVLQTLAAAPSGGGGSWNREGTILFNPETTSNAIFAVSADGSEPHAVTRRDEAAPGGHVLPEFLPDGRRFLYFIAGKGVYLGSLDASEPQGLLVEADSAAAYAPPGYLLFARQGTLFAQEFDPHEGVLSGMPSPVTDEPMITVNAGVQPFVVSAAAGRIVYRHGNAQGGHQLVWFDRDGNRTGNVGPPDLNGLYPSLSPDGRRVALQRSVGGDPADVWVFDMDRGLLDPVVSGPGLEAMALWSPDGSRLVFNSNRTGRINFYEKSLRGGGRDRLLFADDRASVPVDWSQDGRFLLYGSGMDLWALPLDGEAKPFPVAHESSNERNGQFSPDGRWIAYESDESGRDEVYVQSFPDPAIKDRVSVNGGQYPRWRRDGRELFYLTLDGRLIAVPIKPRTNVESLEIGAPATLFETGLSYIGSFARQPYMVSADGERFLVNTLKETNPPMTVILNWRPDQDE